MHQMEANRIACLFTREALGALCALLGLQPVPGTEIGPEEAAMQRGLDWLEDAGHISFMGDRYAVGESLAFLAHALAGQPVKLQVESGDISVQAYQSQGLLMLVDDNIKGRIRIMPLPDAREAASEVVQRLGSEYPLQVHFSQGQGSSRVAHLITSPTQGIALLEEALA